MMISDLSGLNYSILEQLGFYQPMGISGSLNGGTVPIRLGFVGIFPYIGLKNRPYIW